MSGAPSAARPPTHAGYLPPKGGKLNDQIIAKGSAIEMIFFCLAVLYIVSHTGLDLAFSGRTTIPVVDRFVSPPSVLDGTQANIMR